MRRGSEKSFSLLSSSLFARPATLQNDHYEVLDEPLKQFHVVIILRLTHHRVFSINKKLFHFLTGIDFDLLFDSCVEGGLEGSDGRRGRDFSASTRHEHCSCHCKWLIVIPQIFSPHPWKWIPNCSPPEYKNAPKGSKMIYFVFECFPPVNNIQMKREIFLFFLSSPERRTRGDRGKRREKVIFPFLCAGMK